MKAISEFDSLTTCSKRVAADLVESRSEKFQENEKNGLDTESSQGQRHLYLSAASLNFSCLRHLSVILTV